MADSVIGQKVPEFKIKLVGGEEVSFDEWRNGEAALIDFYTTW